MLRASTLTEVATTFCEKWAWRRRIAARLVEVRDPDTRSFDGAALKPDNRSV
jgi:hypothetical protein